MSRFLAISSQVASGHVGLSAIGPALQALGHDVIALPTTILSNHPGHAKVAGSHVDPQLLHEILVALDGNGWLAGITAVLTGYLPSREHVAFACAAVQAIRRHSPTVIVACDPVIGDVQEGIYLDRAAAEAIRDDLIPLADLAFPNCFELGWLTGHSIVDVASAIDAARRLPCETTLVTSLPTGQDELANLLVGPDVAEVCRVPLQQSVPKGTGDFLSAVFVGDADLGRTTARVATLIDLSIGRDELAIASNRDQWLTAEPLPCEIIR